MSDAPCDDIIRAYDEVCAENERLRVALKWIVREAPAWVGRVAVRALNLETDDE